MKKKALIAGGGGFIGGHLAKHLIGQGYAVKCVDIKSLDLWFQVSVDAENIVVDLREKEACEQVVKGCDQVYNLACNMGGMGFIENNKAACMLSVLINTHLLMAAKAENVQKYFFASSACVYPAHLQNGTENISLKEDSVYPAQPEDGYGWEKLFGERMCRHFHEDFGLEVRIARFHNVYGPHGSWKGGREKAPAAICRKVLEALNSETKEIEVWGDGEQVRSFMYIDDCIEGILRLMESGCSEPINIGSSDEVTINELISMVEKIGGTVMRNYKLDAPLGVRGRNSDNDLVLQKLGWQPSIALAIGIRKTYGWISREMKCEETLS